MNTSTSPYLRMLLSAFIGAIGAYLIGTALMYFLADKSWAAASQYGASFAGIAFIVSFLIQLALRQRAVRSTAGD
ncbi:hypothetical protein [Acidipropionibacterium timonense]|uniref:hypothetical protein n=1 Tax=Acidipropionibacterium timonense TaxID=2161818 RepID=UPI00102F5B8E|nr:hypothetical protein [Acidipropionibacterium timonense]